MDHPHARGGDARVSIREFRRLPREQRRQIINSVEDSLAKRVLSVAFLDFGKKSWVQVAVYIGGGNTPDSVRMIAMRELARI